MTLGIESQKYEEFAAEFNTKENRLDGFVIAKALHEGLDSDARNWFYGSIFHWYDDIPLTREQQVDAELSSRREVWFYHCVEAAISAKQNGYIGDDRWFVDWVARLNLGNETAKVGIERRLADYWGKSRDTRQVAFTVHLGSTLPKKTNSNDWIRWHVPLLALSASITTATAFGDEKSAAAHKEEHRKISEEIQTTINKPNSPGWLAVTDHLNTLIRQRIDQLSADSAAKKWIAATHFSCVDLLLATFAVRPGNDLRKRLLQTFGQAFLDMLESANLQQVLTLCSVWYCGCMTAHVTQDLPMESVGLLVRGASIYGRPLDHVQNWLDFAKREKDSIRMGGVSFNQNLGLKVCMGMLVDLGVLDLDWLNREAESGAAIKKSMVDLWAEIGLQILYEIGQIRDGKYLQP